MVLSRDGTVETELASSTEHCTFHQTSLENDRATYPALTDLDRQLALKLCAQTLHQPYAAYPLQAETEEILELPGRR